MVNTKKPNFEGIVFRRQPGAIRQRVKTKPQSALVKSGVMVSDIRPALKLAQPTPVVRRLARRVVRRPVASAVTIPPPSNFWRHLARRGQPLALAMALALVFGFGMWYEASTPQSRAESPQPLAASEPIALGTVPADAASQPVISNEVLFNTPIQLLQDYLGAPTAADQLAERKTKLQQFLSDWSSPLVNQADVIAEQKHWKLILAISFAESTLGKYCQGNNCSGIGGSNLRSYRSLENWIVDFDRLLDRRYQNMTLEQMCGVYVQPCNPHWLVATKQILNALDAARIE
ncbi:MAG: hypothetical protein KGJ93_03750 [Patescibacteria group bacterium]|nr:hypothetical protein [Patescibacteria group bacterium]